MKTKILATSLAIVAMVCITLIITSFTNSKKEIKGAQYLQVTTIESVVPGGLGRSRMITNDASGKLEEIKMENFFSLTGINFENVRSNDRVITDKIEQLSNEGWELYSVNTGAYAGNDNGKVTGGGVGIFVTRYLFKKQ